MSLATDKDILLNTQYDTDKNLSARINLHQKYSINKYNFFSWVFDHMNINSLDNVLELGCGNGVLWLNNNERIPKEANIILSDFSCGMLEAATANLKDSVSKFSFELIDAQSIPHEVNTFNVILANYMLFHIPDIDLALSEIRRVLKPDGRFIATTAGKEHMKEIREILIEFDSEIHFPSDDTILRFGLENGEELISKHFDNVDVLLYKDGIELRESKPLVDYILSFKGAGNISNKLTEERVTDLYSFIDSKIKSDGSIYITKQPCLFKAW